MAYRYALYTRRKDDDCFTFAMSFPTLKLALEQKRDNDKRFSNIESVILESMNPNHRIDPYHIHFAQKETVGA
jgi:hypothetical protein